MTKSNGHPRVVRRLSEGKYMVIDSTMRDSKVDGIFGPVTQRVRERGEAIARELKSTNARRAKA